MLLLVLTGLGVVPLKVHGLPISREPITMMTSSPPPDERSSRNVIAQSDRIRLLNASIVYFIAILLVQLLLNVPGRDVPFYAAIAGGAVLLSLRSSRAVLIWSVVATLLALALLVGDYCAGLEFRRTHTELRQTGHEDEAPISSERNLSHGRGE